MNPSPQGGDAPPQAPVEGGPSAVPKAEGRAIDSGRGRVFPCEQCGAELVSWSGSVIFNAIPVNPD